MSNSVAPTPARSPELARASEPALELSLFGTLSARCGGDVIALRLPQQAIRLLAFLLLNRERIQLRERVAFTLWPDDDEADARANLRRKLHLLQRALPERSEPWILTTATTVAWNDAAPYRLDVAEFERLSAQPATWADADALYSADLLVDLYDDWIVAERDRLRALATDTAAALVARQQQRRDYPAAIRFAQRLRSLDPWREDAVRSLMTLRYEAGDRAGALTEFERFRGNLETEMGVAPMPETVTVYERILTDAGTAASGSAAIGDTPPRTLSGLPFVSREREMQDLRDAWNAAARGAGTAVLVVGEAGIGKSRLIEEFATFADSNGGRVLRGGTTPFELAPYQAFSEAVRGALPILRETRIEPLWLSVLASLVPQFHVAFPNLQRLTALDAEPERTRLFEAFGAVIGALCAARPTLLVLEDMHWAGAGTIALFEHIARHAPGRRLLIVASYREEELARTHVLRAMRRRLERERLLRALALGPLALSAIEDIVRDFVDNEPEQRAAIAAYLYTCSDGNPFFLSEVVANDRESGVFDPARRHWKRRGASPEALGSLSSTLNARLERLSVRARSIVEIAAVVGRAFSAELVREVSGADERATLDGLGELVDRRLVREVEAGGGTDFAFSHHLIQQAVYAALPVEIRQHRHRRVGTVIEELYGEQLEAFAAEIASHFDRGGEREPAAEYYLLAARQALTLYGSDEARSLAARAIELSAEPRLHFRATEILEESARRLGDGEAQAQSIERLLSLAAKFDDVGLRREALARRIRLAHDRAERTVELEAIDALEMLLDGAPAPWAAVFGQLKGSYLTSVDLYREARAVLSAGLRHASPDAYPAIFVDCRCALVELSCFEGRVSDIRAFLDEVPTFEDQHDLGRTVRLLETACGAANIIHDSAALATCAEQLLRCAQAIGYREAEAMAYRYAGQAAWQLFDIDRARDLFTRSVDMFASMGQRLKQFLVLIDIANMINYLGHFDEALERFAAADALATSISYGFGHVACINNVSYAAYLKGEFELARTAAQQALELAEVVEAPSMRAHALVNLGVAERELGDSDAAIMHLTQGTTLERELNETIALGEDLCELIIALLRRGETERAGTLAREVLALVEDSTRRFPHPQYLLWTAAVVHHTLGDELHATALLERARRTLDELESRIADNSSRTAFRQIRYNLAIDDAFGRAQWRI